MLILWTLVSSLAEEIPRLIKVEVVAELSINVGVNVLMVKTIRPC